MKKNTFRLLPALAALVACLAGCTQTKVAGPGFTLSRTSFLQKLEIQSVNVSTNGSMSLSGYQNDGGTDAVAKITSAAVSAAVSSAK